MVTETDVEVSLVVVDASLREDDDETSLPVDYLNDTDRIGLSDVRYFVESLQRERFWALVHAERHLAWRLAGPSKRWELMRFTPVEEVPALSGSEMVDCQPLNAGGPWVKLPESMVQRIGNETDVVIRLGFGLIKGAVLEATEYGVLSFHPSDIRKYRGLSISQAFINDDDELGITLQQLAPKIDGGRIVAFKTVDISDSHTLDNVYGRLMEGQISMLADGVRNLKDPAFTPEVPSDLPEYVSISKRKELKFASRVVAKNVAGRVKRQMRSRL